MTEAAPTRRADSDAFGKTLYKADADDKAVIAAVEKVATARGVPMAQVALAWMLAKPVVTAPIIGASKPHHLDDAVAALALHLSADEIAALEAPYVPQAVAGFS